MRKPPKTMIERRKISTKKLWRTSTRRRHHQLMLRS